MIIRQATLLCEIPSVFSVEDMKQHFMGSENDTFIYLNWDKPVTSPAPWLQHSPMMKVIFRQDI